MYSLEEIERRMKSQSPDERRVAMVMIGKARRHELLDKVISTMQNDVDNEVRAMAAWALDLLGNVEAIPALVDAMYDRTFGVRSNAGWALVHLAQRVMPQLVLPDVIDVLQDKDHEYAREMAYLVLSNINDLDARRAIEQYW
jgi:HEAT repeat protein